MSVLRIVACGVSALFVAAAVGGVSSAVTRSASIGNYYYEDDATGDRSKIVVQKGDQVAFTVREGIYPPHTVEVDELNIHSGDILLGETYTTPPLETVGNFLLYCRPHRERGHVSRLIIQVPAAPAPAAASPTPGTTIAPAGPAATAVSASPTPTPAGTLAPVGVTKASEEELERRPVAVDPDSLEGLTGRTPSRAPWTRSLWFLLIASVPVLAAAALALRREAARASAVPARGTAASSQDRPRSRSRSRRSSAPKASASGRKSPGRRR